MPAINRIRLTNQRVARFTTGKPQAFLWDADVPGLGVRATRGGAKAFVLQHRLNGRTHRITIGSTDAWSLADARERARELRVQFDTGINPAVEKKRQAVLANQQAATFATAWEAYIEERRQGWSELHLRDNQRAMQPPGRPRKRGGGKPRLVCSGRSETSAWVSCRPMTCWCSSGGRHRGVPR